MHVEVVIDTPTPLVEGLVLLEPLYTVPASLHPALVYLASLAVGSRSAMKGSLDLAARLLSVELCDHSSLPWHLVRAPHVRALRAWLRENRSSSTGNKVLSAVRGALKIAWELDQIETEDYRRAAAVKGIKLARAEQATGRAPGFGEVVALLRVCMDDHRDSGCVWWVARCGTVSVGRG